jgi:hypothetical protein
VPPVFNKQGELNKRRITPFWSQLASARRVRVKHPSCGVVELEKGPPFSAFNALPDGFLLHNRMRQLIENAP